MASTTGIELGPESCVLVSASWRRGQAFVQSFEVIEPSAWPSQDVAVVELLKGVRKNQKLPRRARIVAWGLPDGAAADDPMTRAALRPVIDAGFKIDTVLTPAEALANMAAARPRGPMDPATAWLALNTFGVAIAIVRGTDLLFARTFEWNFRAGDGNSRAQLLQRYSLVSHLGPEVKRGIAMVRASHSAVVDSVVTCGNLPDLRSLTMPLIEELDLEVETLDSLEGLKMSEAAKRAGFADFAPALRVACAAVAGKKRLATRKAKAWKPAPAIAWKRPLMIVAAIALLAGGAYAAYALLPQIWQRPAKSPQVAATQKPKAPQVAKIQQPEVRLKPDPTSEKKETAASAKQPEVRLKPDTTPAVRLKADTTVETKKPVPSVKKETAPASAPAVPPQAAVKQAAPAGKPSPEPRTPASAPAVPPQPAVKQAAPAAKPSPEPRTANAKRDTAPKAAIVRLLDAPLPRVSSILLDQSRRLALVNGAIVGVGDQVGPRVVVDIQADSVILREPSGAEVRVVLRGRMGEALAVEIR